MTHRMPLPFYDVPDETVYQPALGAYFHTGHNAVDAVRTLAAGTTVAVDIESPSVTDSFTIKCVTAAWVAGDTTHAVLLDPYRRTEDAWAVRTIAERSRFMVLHNAAFDTPGLVHEGLVTLEQIRKIMDTVVLARLAWPEVIVRKRLEDLAPRILGVHEMKGALKLAQKASGLTSDEKWFRDGDIHMPSYRAGAIADTVITLRIAAPLWTLAEDRLLNHPFAKFGHTDRASAAAQIADMLRVNQVLLRRAALGFRIDRDYATQYAVGVEEQRAAAEHLLGEAGLRSGVGMDILKHLDAAGKLPARWPRTKPSKTRPEGTWKTDKETLEAWLPAHPLADAHRVVAETSKILGYLDKTEARSIPTGKLHPQFNVLGACATGRMSMGQPELQQFSELARPIILCDEGSAGLQSTDWSSIEPALLGWMSNDWAFITPFEQGADIYEPVGRATGKPRKENKVVVLAGMYGQGRAKLAHSLGCTEDEAAQIQAGMRRAMPRAVAFMRQIKDVADMHALTITAAGRILPVERFNGEVAAYKAVNKMFQGSCADLIYSSILALDDMGLGDMVMLPMHDEIVSDVAAAREVQQVMSTPPEYLMKWTGGRVPVIRVDSVAMGPSWQKV